MASAHSPPVQLLQSSELSPALLLPHAESLWPRALLAAMHLRYHASASDSLKAMPSPTWHL